MDPRAKCGPRPRLPAHLTSHCAYAIPGAAPALSGPAPASGGGEGGEDPLTHHPQRALQPLTAAGTPQALGEHQGPSPPAPA
jgi:hypothetical protein